MSEEVYELISEPPETWWELMGGTDREKVNTYGSTLRVMAFLGKATLSEILRMIAAEIDLSDSQWDHVTSDHWKLVDWAAASITFCAERFPVLKEMWEQQIEAFEYLQSERHEFDALFAAWRADGGRY